MRDVKTGTIVRISRNDDLGVIREEGTGTEWFFFLSDMPKKQREQMQVFSGVSFKRDESFELPSFVAMNVQVQRQDMRWVV